MLFTQKRTNVEPTSRTTNNNNNNEIYKRFKECDNVNTMWKMIMITKTTWGTNWKGEQKGKKLKLMTKANQSKYGIVDSIKKKMKNKIYLFILQSRYIYTNTLYFSSFLFYFLSHFIARVYDWNVLNMRLFVRVFNHHFPFHCSMFFNILSKINLFCRLTYNRHYMYVCFI